MTPKTVVTVALCALAGWLAYLNCFGMSISIIVLIFLVLAV